MEIIKKIENLVKKMKTQESEHYRKPMTIEQLYASTDRAIEDAKNGKGISSKDLRAKYGLK